MREITSEQVKGKIANPTVIHWVQLYKKLKTLGQIIGYNIPLNMARGMLKMYATPQHSYTKGGNKCQAHKMSHNHGIQ
jgi:hypothetical protein